MRSLTAPVKSSAAAPARREPVVVAVYQAAFSAASGCSVMMHIMTSTNPDSDRANSFFTALDAKLADATCARAARSVGLADTMAHRETAFRQFDEKSAALMREVVMPRVDAVVNRFPNATRLLGETPDGRRVDIHFSPTPAYPATVDLGLGVLLDRENDRGSISWSLSIIPMLVDFEMRNGCGFEPDISEYAPLVAFVESQLLAFVTLYLTIETDARYQRNARHRDPVCGMLVAGPDAAAHVTHQRRVYYFCSARCHDAFAADPAHFSL